MQITNDDNIIYIIIMSVHIYTYMCVYIYIQAGFLCPESFVCAKSPFGYDPG